MIEVTDELVRHVALLSRLALSDEDLAGLKEHFLKVLAYVEELQAVDTEGVDPSHLSVDTANVFRDDVVQPSLGVPAALANAPQAHAPHFLVPRIVADSDDGAGGSA